MVIWEWFAAFEATAFVVVSVGLIVAWALWWAMWSVWLEHRAMEPLPDTEARRRLMLRYERIEQERRGER